MKLLHYLPYSYHIHTGGLEKIAQTIADGLAKDKNIKSLVIASDIRRGKGKKLSEYTDTIFIPSWDLVYNFPVPQLWKKGFREQFKTIKDYKPDVIVTHTRFFIQSLIGGMIAKWLGVKRVHVEHGSGFVTGYPWYIKTSARLFDWTIGLWIFRQCDEIVTISQMHKVFIFKFTNKEPIVIYNPIDYHLQVKIENKVIHIGFLASLLPRKGCDFLIKALSSSSDIERICTIVGDGSERKNLELLSQSYGLEHRITFVGADDRANRLHKFDIFVNPSYQEGLPTTVVEALLAKCIVLATDVGGTREISDKEDLILVQAGDIQELREKLFIAFDSLDKSGLSYETMKEKFSVSGAMKKYYTTLLQVVRKKIAFITPVGEGGPKTLYRDLVGLLNDKYPEHEYYLISSAKEWFLLHFFNKKYDLIISSIPFFWKPPNCTYIIQQHGLHKNDRGFSNPGRILARLYPYNTLFAKKIIYPSQFLLKYCGYKHKDQQVIFNFTQFKINKRKVVLGNKEEINLTTVTSFSFYDKAIGVLDIFEKLQLFNNKKKINYYICGDGKYIDLIKNSLTTYNLANNIKVVFLGKLLKNEIINLLDKTDVFLYSTFQDTFGISIIEAMSSGIPVLLNNYELFDELFDDEFIAKNNIDFVGKLHKLIEDKDYYEKHLEMGYQNLKRFDKDMIMKQWYEIIKNSFTRN